MGWIERVLALLGLLVTSPVLALAAIAIKLSSQGPVLFRSSRIGENGVPFVMFKLRTMHQGDGSLLTLAGDDRIFPAGRIIRRSKLDEIPQLLNVVRAEMAFIGPRPEDPDIVRRHYRDWMLESLSVPPGIVGPGSLGYFLEESSIPQDPRAAETYYAEVLLPRKIARDLVFVRRRTMAYRLDLLLRTIASIIGADNVMKRWREEEERRAQRILETAGVA